MPNHAEQLAQELNLNVKNVQGAIELIDQGNTIPFIARYRKEATGSMDDQVLRDLGDRLEYLRGLDKRKDEVTSSITEQGAMTPELTAALSKAKTLAEVEDIYRPYKPKRKTRASIAKARGLQPLATAIFRQDAAFDPERAAADYLNDEVPDAAAALAGAQDIIAEAVSDDAACRAERGRERNADKILCPERFCHSSHLAIYYGTVRQRKKDGICGKLSPLRYRSIAFFHFSAGKSSSSAQASR